MLAIKACSFVLVVRPDGQLAEEGSGTHWFRRLNDVARVRELPRQDLRGEVLPEAPVHPARRRYAARLRSDDALGSVPGCGDLGSRPDCLVRLPGNPPERVRKGIAAPSRSRRAFRQTAVLPAMGWLELSALAGTRGIVHRSLVSDPRNLADARDVVAVAEGVNVAAYLP
jgi:hypothetical protein